MSALERIQGKTMAQWASDKKPPFFLYDGEKISGQYQKMKSAFAHLPLQIHFALKSLNNPAILKLMKSLGAGLDAVSLNEVALGLKLGFSPSDILFTPNAGAWEDYVQAMEWGVKMNIDSLEILEVYAEKIGSTYPLCLRINPHIQAGGHRHIQVAHRDSKFGISLDYWPQVLSLCQKYKLNIEGLHLHTGSDIGNLESFVEASSILFHLAESLPTLQYLDFGSGFKVPYFEGDKETDLSALGQVLGTKWEEFRAKTNKKLKVIFEPGKYLVAQAGTLVVSVNTTKKTPGVHWIMVNSGLNHLIRPMLYQAYHEVFLLSPRGGEKEKFSVAGTICETDTLAEDRWLAPPQPGDLLGIKNAGAYGMTMSSHYNLQVRPAEYLLWQGQEYRIRRLETLDDLLDPIMEISEKVFT